MSSIEEQRRKLQELQEQATISQANGGYVRGSLYEARIYSGTGSGNGTAPDTNGAAGATPMRLSDVLDKSDVDVQSAAINGQHAATLNDTQPAAAQTDMSQPDTRQFGTITKGAIAEQWSMPEESAQTTETNGHSPLHSDTDMEQTKAQSSEPHRDRAFDNRTFDDHPFGSQPSAPPTLDNQAAQGEINIKGRADGITIEMGRGNWRPLLIQLTQRLEQAAGFFRGGQVLLDVAQRPLTEAELKQIRDLLASFGMTLSVIRSSSEQTGQLALAMGLASSTIDGVDARPAESNHDTLTHFVYRGNLRSGQVLERHETIIVMGDVNPGAHVASAGDILVWGRLRGVAHAGATGDVNAVVAALGMDPTQLRIADQITILPEERRGSGPRWMPGKQTVVRPEIAFLNGEQVVVEAWDETKPGGIMAFRK